MLSDMKPLIFFIIALILSLNSPIRIKCCKLWFGLIKIVDRLVCVATMLFFFFFCLFHRNYMNDSLSTNVFVRFQAETIACACIFLAARALQVIGNVIMFWFPSTSNLITGDRSIVPSKVITLCACLFSSYLFQPGLIGTCCLEPVKRRLRKSASLHSNSTPERR